MAGNSYGGYVGGSDGDFPEHLRVSPTDCYENGVAQRVNSANQPDNQCHFREETVPAFFWHYSVVGGSNKPAPEPASFAAFGFDRYAGNLRLADKAFAP